jgi:hypothetical protein
MAIKLLENCASKDAYIVLMKDAKHAMDVSTAAHTHH